MERSIIKYVKHPKSGKKIGMFVGVPHAVLGLGVTNIEIGWSRCRFGDVFDPIEAGKHANMNLGQPVPPSFRNAAMRFRTQCFEHFENADHIQKITVMDYPKIPRVRMPKAPRNSGHHPSCPRSGCQDTGKVQPVCRCYELKKADAQIPF